MEDDEKFCPMPEITFCLNNRCAWFVKSLGACAVPALTATIMAFVVNVEKSQREGSDD